MTLTLVPIPGTQIAGVASSVDGDLVCGPSPGSEDPGVLACDVRAIGGNRTVVDLAVVTGTPAAVAGRVAVRIRGTGRVRGPIDRPGAPSFEPFGAVCPVWCLFEARTQVGGDLRAEPLPGSPQVFDHWSGDCRANGTTCQMLGRVQSGHEATAHFREAGTWSFEIEGEGQINVDPGQSGTDRDPDAPAACREECSHTMKQGRRYRFEADADPGGCSRTSPTCRTRA